MKIQYYADIPPDAYTPYITRYYDNYDFININSGNTGHRHLFEVSSPTVTATGLQTGSAVASSSYSTLYTAYRYDEKGNVVYSEEWDEYLQSHRLSVSSAYDFTGNETIRTEKYEEMAEQTVIDTHTARFTSSYDALGRILSQHLSVNGASPVLVYSNGYDALGRLSRQWRGTEVTYGYDIRSHLSGTASDIYTERVHYAVDAGASAGLEQASWPTFRFANRIEESWPERADSLPERSLDWYLYYDGLGRLSGGVSHDSGYSETVDTDLDANVREVRRVFRGAAVQDAVIGYTAGMATDVRDVSSPYYGERVGRFPAGDYTLSYDAAGRLIADGTRGITAIHYNDWSHIPATINADGFRVNTEVTPDGRLRSRSVSVPYIETIVKVNADGDTVIRNRTRYLSRASRMYGCFEVSTNKKEVSLRINTPVGFYDVDEGRQYWHLTNRQGSVMALLDSDGNTHRRSAHYPSGTPFVLDGDDTAVPDAGLPDDRHHIGNRWVSFGGLDWYDNTARMHDPLLMHFIAPDPLAHDFLPYSPWSHCAANPANITDPDGKRVWAFDSYGYISLVSKTDCRDVERFIFVNGNSEQVKDDNGDPIQIDIEKGSVITLQRYREGVDFDVIKVRGDENGMKLYHFLSDITGKESGIEFSYVQTGKEGKNGLNFISTSHKIKAEASMSSLYNTQLSNGYTVRFDSHSHPGGSPPSPNDKEYKIQISNLSKSLKAHVPKFSIYSVPQKEEQPF